MTVEKGPKNAAAGGPDAAPHSHDGKGASVGPKDLWLGLTCFLVGAAIVSLLQLLGVGPLAKIQASGGTDAFAISYLMAQVVERAIEPFSNLKVGQKNIWGHSSAMRTVSLGGLASAMAMVACFFTTGIFAIAGITFTVGGRVPDAILTGLLISGGTKALHDLIGTLQKAKSG